MATIRNHIAATGEVTRITRNAGLQSASYSSGTLNGPTASWQTFFIAIECSRSRHASDSVKSNFLYFFQIHAFCLQDFKMRNTRHIKPVNISFGGRRQFYTKDIFMPILAGERNIIPFCVFSAQDLRFQDIPVAHLHLEVFRNFTLRVEMERGEIAAGSLEFEWWRSCRRGVFCLHTRIAIDQEKYRQQKWAECQRNKIVLHVYKC